MIFKTWLDKAWEKWKPTCAIQKGGLNERIDFTGFVLILPPFGQYIWKVPFFPKYTLSFTRVIILSSWWQLFESSDVAHCSSWGATKGSIRWWWPLDSYSAPNPNCLPNLWKALSNFIPESSWFLSWDCLSLWRTYAGWQVFAGIIWRDFRAMLKLLNSHRAFIWEKGAWSNKGKMLKSFPEITGKNCGLTLKHSPCLNRG